MEAKTLTGPVRKAYGRNAVVCRPEKTSLMFYDRESGLAFSFPRVFTLIPRCWWERRRGKGRKIWQARVRYLDMQVRGAYTHEIHSEKWRGIPKAYELTKIVQISHVYQYMGRVLKKFKCFHDVIYGWSLES